MKTSNEAVRTLLSQRNDERMQKEKAALANARNAADEAYRELVLKLNASAVIEDNTEGIEGVISQVNELIKYYRQYVLPKYGKGDKENEGTPAPAVRTKAAMAVRTRAAEPVKAVTTAAATTAMSRISESN